MPIRVAVCCCVALPLVLAAGCAGIQLPDPPVKDVAQQRQQRTEEAVKEFEKHRDFAEYQAAMACYQRHDFAGCEEQLQRLLKRNPHHCDARLMLAELYLADSQLPQALAQAEQALEDQPHNPRALYTTGLLLDATGQQAGALAYYAQAAKLEPDNELYVISYHTARADVEADQADLFEALPVAGECSAARPVAAGVASPTVSRSENSGGAVYGASADGSTGSGPPAADPAGAPAAGPACRGAVPAAAVISAAVTSLRQNRPQQAVDLLAPLLQSGNCQPQVLQILAVAHYRLGDYRSSELALQQALSLDNSSPLTYFLMGCTLARVGQTEAARAYLQQAGTLDARYRVEP